MDKFTKEIPPYCFLNLEPWCCRDSRQTKTHYQWPLWTILHTCKVTRLVAERPRNFSSIPGTGRILCSSIQTITGAHPTFSFIGTRGSFPTDIRSGSQQTTHSHIVLRLKLQETVALIPHVWCLTWHTDLLFTFSLHIFLGQIRSTSSPFPHRNIRMYTFL